MTTATINERNKNEVFVLYCLRVCAPCVQHSNVYTYVIIVFESKAIVFACAANEIMKFAFIAFARETIELAVCQIQCFYFYFIVKFTIKWALSASPCIQIMQILIDSFH